MRLPIHEEVVGRDAATRRLRRTTANFPTGKTLASWRAEDSCIPEPTQNALITLEWIARAQARTAIEKDPRVAWFTLETLTAAIARRRSTDRLPARSRASAAPI